MRQISFFFVFSLALLFSSCEIFLDDIGSDGEPCADNGACNDGLVCKFGSCGPPAELGDSCDQERQWYDNTAVCNEGLWCIDNVCVEAGGIDQPCGVYDELSESRYCDNGLYCIDGICIKAGGLEQPCMDYNDGWDDSGDCDSGLYCIDGTCLEAGGKDQPCISSDRCDDGLRCIDDACRAPLPDEDVKQPDSNLYWKRCPLAMHWTGWECEYDDYDYFDGEYGDDDGISACPNGYRLPSKAEVMKLLGDCERNVEQGDSGYCNSCAESKACVSMFFDDDGVYWLAELDPLGDLEECFDFYSGWIDTFCYQKLKVRCVR